MGKKLKNTNSQRRVSPLIRQQQQFNEGNFRQFENQQQFNGFADQFPSSYPVTQNYPQQTYNERTPNIELQEISQEDVAEVLNKGCRPLYTQQKSITEWNFPSTTGLVQIAQPSGLSPYGNAGYNNSCSSKLSLPDRSIPYNNNTSNKTSLVSLYPQIENFTGEYNFGISFPANKPTLIVKKDESGKRCIFTKRKIPIPFTINHTAGQDARVRFFVVFSNPGELSTPVQPCKNDLNPNHPCHMVVIDGAQQTVYESSTHPSVEVIPSYGSTNLPGTYWVQIKIMCRNSCLTRKDLTLVCQLEKESQVVGRENFDLKVCACPRRDASPKQKPTTNSLPSNSQKSTFLESENQSNNFIEKTNHVINSIDQNQNMPPGDDVSTSFTSALQAGRTMALLSFLQNKFKELQPRDYEASLEEFTTEWRNNVG